MKENTESREIYQITAQRLSDQFPPVDEALREPEGLLAAGGDLSIKRLVEAYRQGIFPWFDQNEPILWWSPNPRTVFYPVTMHASRSMQKFLKKKPFHFSYDQTFEEVIRHCSAPRRHQAGTWLSEQMIEAYCALHADGFAHSIECWKEDQLVGGVYGVAIGQVFYGESMFSRETNASKACLLRMGEDLHQWGYQLFDCQVYSDHLATLGAQSLSRTKFVSLLQHLCSQKTASAAWTMSHANQESANLDSSR